jgi:uncharacterized protein
MAIDLNDKEIDQLDHQLADVPSGLEPLDVVMLDGYLCGVLVQPRLVPPEDWLPPVFDLEGRARPFDMNPEWFAGTRALIERRHAVLQRGLAEEGWFDPILPQDAPDVSEAEGEEAAAWGELPEHSRLLSSWVAGFQYALSVFPDLEQQADDSADAVMDRLFRHLPPESDEHRAAMAAAAASHPVRNVEEAVTDLVSAVAELWELTSDARYKVQTVKREAPKVGRNDPCPCGSGKKFKACHGR